VPPPGHCQAAGTPAPRKLTIHPHSALTIALQYVAAVVAAAQEAVAEQLVLVTPPGGGTAQSTGFSLFGAPKGPAGAGGQASRSQQLVAGSGIGYVCIRASGLDR
jgi:hypothetical protein